MHRPIFYFDQQRMLTAHLRKQQAESLQFSQLQLPFRCIKVINNVPASVCFIIRLDLTGNHLVSLNGIHQFHNLETLLFNYNHIALPSELAKINNPFFLKEISYIGNPLYYSTELTVQELKSMGFTRLRKLNQFQRVQASPLRQKGRVQMGGKAAKNANVSVAQTDYTARRRPNYRHSPDEDPRTSKKIIGKIYTTKFTTRRRVSKEDPPRHTRESTIKQSIDASVPFEPRESPRDSLEAPQGDVKPFEQSLMGESAETAKFSETSEIQRLGQQFLSEEKELLADYYHKRNLLEKCFHSWRHFRVKSIETQLEAHRGELINNTLETLHFSLIKLRHEFIQRT